MKKVLTIIAFGLTLFSTGCESPSLAKEDKPLPELPPVPETGPATAPETASAPETAPASAPETASASEPETASASAPATAPASESAPAKSFDALDELSVYEPELFESGGVKIKRLTTTTAIEAREPVAPSSVFATDDEQIYAFMDLQNTNDEPIDVVVKFVGPEGQSTGHVSVTIPASVPRWRTWAYTRYANTPGQWTVRVELPDGTLLGKLAFDIDVCC